jgi:nucleotide-binding universal stress UspA family protein
MIKTIFIPTSGSSTDHSVFATALAVARPMAAHLDFYHLRQTIWEAAARVRHLEFREGPAINEAVEQLQHDDESLAANARRHSEEFCSANQIMLRDTPTGDGGVSATISQETDHAAARLMLHARHSDLVVLGRRRNVDLMPDNLVEMLLVDSGRPIMIAPDSPPRSVTGTIVIAWKETPEAARSLGAAMPLLKLAQRVVLVGIAEERGAAPDALDHLARQLAWHGIVAEPRSIVEASKQTSALLLETSSEIGADLLVVGGFSHKPLREAVFGGVTSALIEHAELPVFMMH